MKLENHHIVNIVAIALFLIIGIISYKYFLPKKKNPVKFELEQLVIENDA